MAPESKLYGLYFERIKQCREMSGKQLGRLYGLCESAPVCTLDFFVPPSLKEGEAAMFAGKNSLAAFTHFEKHFIRHNGAIIGINVQSMSWVTGPGYFTIPGAVEGFPKEILFDYTQTPETAPEGWPAPKKNTAGLSRFVYKDMHDWNRLVSPDVCIGMATRLGEAIGQFYVLARK